MDPFKGTLVEPFKGTLAELFKDPVCLRLLDFDGSDDWVLKRAHAGALEESGGWLDLLQVYCNV